jgi:hypothetical protein
VLCSPPSCPAAVAQSPDHETPAGPETPASGTASGQHLQVSTAWHRTTGHGTARHGMTHMTHLRHVCWPSLQAAHVCRGAQIAIMCPTCLLRPLAVFFVSVPCQSSSFQVPGTYTLALLLLAASFHDQPQDKIKERSWPHASSRVRSPSSCTVG